MKAARGRSAGSTLHRIRTLPESFGGIQWPESMTFAVDWIESARRNALPAWLQAYNHHRPHTAIGGHPPISRLTNLPGQHTVSTDGTRHALRVGIS